MTNPATSSAGRLFVIAAPSGAGKTTLTRMLLEADPAIRLSVSCTTRPPRTGEIDGHAYRFIDVARFEAMKAAGDFLEWAQVHGNFYGTSKPWIDEQRAAGRDVLLEIDWQGARQVRSRFPDVVGIFVLPPSMDELRRRLVGRGTDSEEVIARRLAAAQGEMAHVDEFDHVIINDDVSRALADLLAVVAAARLAVPVQRAKHPELFAAIAAQ